jgi:hypothetical protein
VLNDAVALLQQFGLQGRPRLQAAGRPALVPGAEQGHRQGVGTSSDSAALEICRPRARERPLGLSLWMWDHLPRRVSFQPRASDFVQTAPDCFRHRLESAELKCHGIPP